MNIDINAVYENGVLKPLEPVALPEHQQVQVSIRVSSGGHEPEVEAAVLERQNRALAELLKELAKFPLPPRTDNFSSSDHDAVLYGPAS